MSDEQFVYHVSSGLYEDIRAIQYQVTSGKVTLDRLKKHGDKSYIERYIREVNVFPGMMSAEDVSLLRRKGFVNWGKGTLYVYKIDLKQVESLIISINVTSTPEQTEFNDKNWTDWYNKHKHKVDEDYFKERDIYRNRLKAYLESKGIKGVMTVDEYITLISTRDWQDVSKYVKLNARIGNKKQYASYIPHVQLEVSGPLEYVEIVELN